MKRVKYFILLLTLVVLCGCAEEQNGQQPTGATKAPKAAETQAPTETPRATETPVPTEAPIELTVYSQTSGYWGEQQGWFAKIMLDKFNVILYIQPDVYDEDSETDTADIIVFGNTGNRYLEAAENNRLLDWEENNLLQEHGSYIKEHMAKALEHNRALTPELGKVFGFGHNVATSTDCIDDFFYTWDIRWDLYKRLGYQEVEDLEDLIEVLEQMKAICPKDEMGNETYAVSLWPDWDTTMVMNVKSMASAYYGYDELGMGLYDTNTGAFYGALQENGPYLEMLRFFNTLYRKELLDPASSTQTYEDMLKKLNSSGILFSLFNYSGSLSYNTEEHLAENKYMASLAPEEATLLTYGISVFGGNRVWTISADTKHPELCMEIINWLCTPEGRMVSDYGPRGVIWDYDEEGNTYFTEFGKLCQEDGLTQMTGEYAGDYYRNGFPQINNTTWSYNADNPDSNGETYNSNRWKSNVLEASCIMEQDWRDYTGALTVFDYLKAKNYVAVPATFYKEAEKSKELESAWEQVSDCIVTGSWKAIYAESEEEFEALVSDMTATATALGYEECIGWCKQEAKVRFALEQAARE